jgi:serine protease AprX
MPEDDPGYPSFEEIKRRISENLTRNAVTEPLFGKIIRHPGRAYDVIIETNRDFESGRQAAIARISDIYEQASGELLRGSPAAETGHGLRKRRPDDTHPYVFGNLTGLIIQRMVEIDNAATAQTDRGIHQPVNPAAAIYRIWEDSQTGPLLNRSVCTVKADAAQRSFCANGSGVVWAVLDSGIQRNHPHFQKHKNLDLDPPLRHLAFTDENNADPEDDIYGHGSHVAGIIAGIMPDSTNQQPFAVARIRDQAGNINYERLALNQICGIAPACKLVSMKVLRDNNTGLVSFIIDALEEVLKTNEYGRHLRIHGVNLSVGYDFDPEWFACGQSPLCVVVDRVVRSGVVVVVAAGNTGYGWNQTKALGTSAAGLALTINDPGNAENAITVGSTHRDMPHLYGVSYFSSKGPTGDGRRKPDLVAPGERIISCAAGSLYADVQSSAVGKGPFQYIEYSGTSMAAPHVSGAIAAFLSIRSEFMGRPEALKKIFMDSATDLGRERSFQGAGLLDLMRAIQSV